MSDDVAIRLKLQDQARVSKGLKDVAGDVGRLDRTTRSAGAGGERLGRGLDKSARSMDSTRKSSGGLKSALGGVSRSMLGLGGAAVGILGVGAAFSSVSSEYQEAAKVGALTANVIQSTGGVAGITAGHVNDLAGSISMKTAVDDEAVQTGANLLLTFDKIRNGVGKNADIFDRATAAAVDLSASGFGSIDSASKQLGRALQDPVKGMTALSRSGVGFDAQQQKTIKGMVASGNLLGAQQVLMAAVEHQVKGSAAAQATSVDRLKNSANNLAEALGTTLAPAAGVAVDGLAGLVTSAGATVGGLAEIGAKGGIGAVVDEVDRLIGAGGSLSSGLRGIASAGQTIGPVLLPVAGLLGGVLLSGLKLSGQAAGFLGTNLGTIVTILGPLAAGFLAYQAVLIATEAPMAIYIAANAVMTAGQWALNAAMTANPIGLVLAGLVALGAGFYVAYQRSETFRGALQGAWSWIKGNWPLLASIIAPPFAPLIFVARHFGDVKSAAQGAWNTVRDGAVGVGGAIDSVVGKVENLIGKLKSVTGIPGNVLGTAGDLAGGGLGLLGFKADGGPITRTGPYMVGERGPEVVTLGSGSYVTPNHQLGALSAPSMPRVAAPSIGGGGGGGSAVAMSESTAQTLINLLRNPVAPHVSLDGQAVNRGLERAQDRKQSRR